MTWGSFNKDKREMDSIRKKIEGRIGRTWLCCVESAGICEAGERK